MPTPADNVPSPRSAAPAAPGESYEVVAVGSGFGTSFFLHRYLQRRPGARVLVLEAGGLVSGADQRREAKTHLEWRRRGYDEHIVNTTPEKHWKFFRGFGGGSNCWVACTPRLLPDDFRLRSAFGFGQDWPLGYDDLEAYYCDAEEVMNVSGEAAPGLFPRSRPHPQPPHRMTSVDRLLRERHPDTFVNFPTARARVAVPGQRSACSANHACLLCPVNAKFTVENGLADLYANVELRLNSPAVAVEVEGGRATGVRWRDDADGGREHVAKADLVVLGAGGMFNPHLLLKSGFGHPLIGVGLSEQCSRTVLVDLEQDGLNGFDASSLSVMMGYDACLGDRRRDRAGAMANTVSRPDLRLVPNRWLSRLRVNFCYEDTPLDSNRVTYDPAHPDRPVVAFHRKSERTERALRDENVMRDVRRLVDGLPVGHVDIGPEWKTESHVQCTTRFALDPEQGVADGDGLMHDCRNVVLTGSGLFPTSAPGNPTLTIAALALRSADRITS